MGYSIEYIFLSKNKNPDFKKQEQYFQNINFTVVNPRQSKYKNTFIGKLIYLSGLPSRELLDLLFNYRKPLQDYVNEHYKLFPKAIFHFEAIDSAVCLNKNSHILSVWSNHDYISERYQKRQKVINNKINLNILIYILRLRKVENLIFQRSKLILTISKSETKKYNNNFLLIMN